ncbi:MAG: hypothetical protein Phog2KO_50840 [Phototrophicaceae bacterium]
MTDWGGLKTHTYAGIGIRNNHYMNVENRGTIGPSYVETTSKIVIFHPEAL